MKKFVLSQTRYSLNYNDTAPERAVTQVMHSRLRHNRTETPNRAMLSPTQKKSHTLSIVICCQITSPALTCKQRSLHTTAEAPGRPCADPARSSGTDWALSGPQLLVSERRGHGILDPHYPFNLQS